MCKHCATFIEDKDIVHAFMERAAVRVSEKLGRTITADALDVRIEFNDQRKTAHAHPDIMRLIYKDLAEMHE